MEMRVKIFLMALKYSPGVLIRYAFCALIILLPGQGISQAGDLETVLVISIDALHPDALSPQTIQNIYRLMEQGAYTLAGQSTSPPLTLLAHAAMFSGLGPEKNGRTDNRWQEGEPRIKEETIFNIAKSRGYSTGFFYSKEKLGYLVNPSVDYHQLDPEFSLENAAEFFKGPEKARFCFLHISGLDRTGSREGWLSPEYKEELFFIDETLAPLIRMVESKGSYLIIITSDHAGHGTLHGSDHPEDAKLPLVLVSDRLDLEQYQGIEYQVTDFKSILEKLLSHLD